MYNTESLEGGIEKCRINIKTFKDAIDKERETIKEYRSMIETLGRKEREKIEAMAHVEVVRNEHTQ